MTIPCKWYIPFFLQQQQCDSENKNFLCLLCTSLGTTESCEQQFPVELWNMHEVVIPKIAAIKPRKQPATVPQKVRKSKNDKLNIYCRYLANCFINLLSAEAVPEEVLTSRPEGRGARLSWFVALMPWRLLCDCAISWYMAAQSTCYYLQKLGEFFSLFFYHQN